MSDTDQTQPNEVETTEAVELTDEQAVEVAKHQQYAKTKDVIDPTMGGMGGAGASGSGPDIADQSAPTPGNHSDLPAGLR